MSFWWIINRKVSISDSDIIICLEWTFYTLICSGFISFPATFNHHQWRQSSWSQTDLIPVICFALKAVLVFPLVLSSTHIIKIITLLVWRTCCGVTVIIVKWLISIIRNAAHLLKHDFIVVSAFILRMNIVHGFLMFIHKCCRPWIPSGIKITRLWETVYRARPLNYVSTNLPVFSVDFIKYFLEDFCLLCFEGFFKSRFH